MSKEDQFVYIIKDRLGIVRYVGMGGANRLKAAKNGRYHNAGVNTIATPRNTIAYSSTDRAQAARVEATYIETHKTTAYNSGCPSNLNKIKYLVTLSSMPAIKLNFTQTLELLSRYCDTDITQLLLSGSFKAELYGRTLVPTAIDPTICVRLYENISTDC